jgi:hypothetical protein
MRARGQMWYHLGMRWLAMCALLAAGCGSTGSTVGQAWRKVTKLPRSSFENPGDAVGLAPSVDSGFFGTDPNSDCSSCPPR